MRAVTVLICLALGRDISASIFRNSYRPLTDSLNPQSLNYGQQQVRSQHQWQKSSSSESDESMEQSKQYKHLKHDQSSLRVEKNWNSPYFTTVISRSEAVPTGNVIAWRQVQAEPRQYVSSSEEITYTSRQTGDRPEPYMADDQIFKDAYKTMKHISEEDKRNIHQAFLVNEQTPREITHSNATEMLKQNQYGVEEHVVKTDDGYYLTIFRIQPKQQITSEQQKRPIALLVHGLLGSADDWLLMGPGKSLAYKMVDEGFDVWLGNTRGSKYSRRHASKHPAQPDFWHYSIDEIALQDLPAMIDYVLNTNQESKLYYVGHSQGTTAFFALASISPEYRQKVAVMYALSPMVYMTNVRSPLLRMISPNSPYYQVLHDELGHGQFKPRQELIAKVGGEMCESQIGCHHVCTNVNFVMAGVDTSGMEPSLIPVITNHLPAGASTRQIKQYGQAVAADQFRMYDYGTHINQKVYGTLQPPKYNMTDVNIPVVIYHSEEDWMAHPKDVERLSKELPNVREIYKVPEEHFSHMDFQFSKKAPQVVNDRLIESIKKDYSY